MYSSTEDLGIGFGNDEYNYDSNFFPLFDPYIPIEQEEMGRNWNANEFDSSEQTIKQYPYHNIYDKNDPMRKKDYYLDNSDTVREYLFTNTPTFHATEPFSAAGYNVPMEYFMIFVVLFLILLLIISLSQGSKIDKLYSINKSMAQKLLVIN